MRSGFAAVGGIDVGTHIYRFICLKIRRIERVVIVTFTVTVTVTLTWTMGALQSLLLFCVKTTSSNHAFKIPLTSSAFCHNAQWPAFTSLLVNLGTLSGILALISGLSAVSFKASTNSTSCSSVGPDPDPEPIDKTSPPRPCWKKCSCSSTKLTSRVRYQFNGPCRPFRAYSVA